MIELQNFKQKAADSVLGKGSSESLSGLTLKDLLYLFDTDAANP